MSDIFVLQVYFVDLTKITTDSQKNSFLHKIKYLIKFSNK